MVFRNLSPLVRSPSEIAYAKQNDLKPILPSNPYDKTEEQIVKEFNSSISTPQLVFLGLDESQGDGLQYKNYIGDPQFAVDITPKASYEKEARGVIAEMEKRGLTFIEGMRAMNFPANTGMQWNSVVGALLTFLQLQYMQWEEHSSIGMHEIRIVELAASQLCLSMVVQSASVHQQISQPYLGPSVVRLQRLPPHLESDLPVPLEPPFRTLPFLALIPPSLLPLLAMIAGGYCSVDKKDGHHIGTPH